MTIRPFERGDIKKVKAFADRYIGENYFTDEQLQEALENSATEHGSVSFVAEDSAGEIAGLRLSYPQGKWDMAINGLSRDQWRVPAADIAYFQSLFVASDRMGLGIGPKMSAASIEVIRKAGAKAILCHSWLESPNNSSVRYLKKLGFQEVAYHPHFWSDVDYLCSGCQVKPCTCTAVEMILYLST
jgi:ribosomal protein S18 acetylase RimI-like enzyme